MSTIFRQQIMRLHTLSLCNWCTALLVLLLHVPMMMEDAMAKTPATAFDFSFEAIEGGEIALDTWRGKVLLVVNTASRCGFTNQYDALQQLWKRYADKGLVVIGVPSNDFGNQEPGSNAEIKDFCSVSFGVDFPLAARTRVRGAEAHPFYRWAAAEAGMLGKPKWNFHKYLFGRDGQLIDWYGSTTSPLSDKLVATITAALDQD